MSYETHKAEAESEKEPKPEYTFDLSTIESTAKITEVHQEGNFLVGTTDKGVRFRHHIPQGKMLNKVDGKYILQDMIIR